MIRTVTCPYGHQFKIEIKRYHHGSEQALLFTNLPRLHELIISKAVSLPDPAKERSVESWHEDLDMSGDRAFSARWAELFCLDIVIRKELDRIPTLEEALANAQNLPSPLVVFRFDIPRAAKAIRLKDGFKAVCTKCGNFKTITLRSLLDDARLCKKCVKEGLDSRPADVIA